MSLYGHMLPFFFAKCLGVEWLGHTVNLYLTFKEAAKWFSKAVVPLSFLAPICKELGSCHFLPYKIILDKINTSWTHSTENRFFWEKHHHEIWKEGEFRKIHYPKFGSFIFNSSVYTLLNAHYCHIYFCLFNLLIFLMLHKCFFVIVISHFSYWCVAIWLIFVFQSCIYKLAKHMYLVLVVFLFCWFHSIFYIDDMSFGNKESACSSFPIGMIYSFF